MNVFFGHAGHELFECVTPGDHFLRFADPQLVSLALHGNQAGSEIGGQNETSFGVGLSGKGFHENPPFTKDSKPRTRKKQETIPQVGMSHMKDKLPAFTGF
jgi:hypothetical protein